MSADLGHQIRNEDLGKLCSFLSSFQKEGESINTSILVPFISFLFSLFVLLPPSEVFAQPKYKDGEVIVKLKSQLGSMESYAFLGKAQYQQKMVLKHNFGKMNIYHYATKPGKTVEQTLDELRADPNVEYAEPNYILTKEDISGLEQAFSSDEVLQMSQSGAKNLLTDADISLNEARQSVSAMSVTNDADKPIVAIIDTGMDLTHSVFVDSGAVWTNPHEIPNNGVDDDGNGYIDDVHGWNFVNNSGNMYDDDGHGTHVAGIILGVGEDIFSSPVEEAKIRIMPLKFLDAHGSGTTADAIQAIYYAVNNGAKVLNNSWGGPNYSVSLQEAVAYTYSKGVVFVAAAGNTGSNNDYSPLYPASYDVPNVMSIAATDSSDSLASFSNFGASSVNIGSPGVSILSTIPNEQFGLMSGTSMATPFISGLAALMLIESPNMLGYQVKNIIFSEADVVSQLSGKVSTDAKVDVNSALVLAKTAQVMSSQPTYTTSVQQRQVASAMGGCGLVSKMYKDMNQNGSGGSSPGPWNMILLLGILCLPLLGIHYLRSQHPEFRRKHRRFEMNSSVQIKVGDEFLKGSIRTISVGGVQLDTQALLSQGSVVTMQIRSPEGGESIEVQGNIVWSKDQQAYGVQFVNQSQGVKKLLKSWTKSLKPT